MPPELVDWVGNGHGKGPLKRCWNDVFHTKSAAAGGHFSGPELGMSWPQNSAGNAADATGESGTDDFLRSHLVGYHCLAGEPRVQVCRNFWTPDFHHDFHIVIWYSYCSTLMLPLISPFLMTFTIWFLSHSMVFMSQVLLLFPLYFFHMYHHIWSYMCFPAVSLHQIAFSWSIWSICLGPHISNVSHRSEKMAIKWEDAEV